MEQTHTFEGRTEGIVKQLVKDFFSKVNYQIVSQTPILKDEKTGLYHTDVTFK